MKKNNAAYSIFYPDDPVYPACHVIHGLLLILIMNVTNFFNF